MSKINVKGLEITVVNNNGVDEISLTDMVRDVENNHIIISNWLRNRNTLEYLGLWEKLNNPDFKLIEFEGFIKDSGLNKFSISAKKWIETTNAIGLKSKQGKTGGTFAHKDVAFHFGLWLSPEFNLLLIKEFQRLKEDEAARLSSGWDQRRFLAKTNYVIHTDDIKEHIIPELTDTQAKFAYSSEADMLNVALFGLTSKQWKERNPEHASQGLNMRDLADVHQLIVLSNLENNNAYLIGKSMPQRERLLELRKNAISQIKSLRSSSYTLDKIKSPFNQNAIGTSSPKNTDSGDSAFDATINSALKKGAPPK